MSTDQAPLTGACQCRAVTYTITPAPVPAEFNYCHCTICQRLSGSAFLPFVGFPLSSTKFQTSSTSLSSPASPQTMSPALKTYNASPHARRQFCSYCGSPLSMLYKARPDTIYITVGTLDAESAARLPRPKEHIYVGEKAEWFGLAEGDGMGRCETMESADVLLPKTMFPKTMFSGGM